MFMKPNLRAFDRLVRFLLGAFLIFAALVLFTHPLARVLATIAGIYALLECLTSSCPLYARLGMKSSADVLKSESLYLLGLLGVQGVLAYEWWNAGWRSEEHTSELQSQSNLVCRLLLEKKKK